ncbi:MAG: hypothetical protein R2698_14330 [Microthrixaceae bacterium]
MRVPGRADWAALFETGISVLCAPLDAGLESSAVELDGFLRRGGTVAWGAVPVDEPLGMGVDRLWRRLASHWASLVEEGLDPELLRERSLITPAASLAGFGISQTERVLRLTSELSRRVYTHMAGGRISVGA